MDQKNRTVVTADGLKKLKSEVNALKKKREELRESIEEMRNKGDLSENEGYTLSLEEFQSNEKRIIDIENTIKSARVVTTDTDNKQVSIGNRVTLQLDGVEMTYEIVGDTEANPLERKISSRSPLGSALSNKKKGDKVKITLPKGEVEYLIVGIE